MAVIEFSDLAEEIVAKGGLTPTDVGEAVLNEGQLEMLLTSIENVASIRPWARSITMERQVENLDRVAFGDDVLRSADSEHSDGVDSSDYYKPDTHNVKLSAVERRLDTMLQDRTVRRMIGRGNFEQQLLAGIGEAIGRSLELDDIFASTDFSGLSGRILQKYEERDGWVHRADNSITAGTEFQENDKPSVIFKAALEAVPSKYLRSRGDWAFWVPWSVEQGYREELADRNTDLGDSAQAQAPELRYQGFRVAHAPALDHAVANDLGVGNVALLLHNDNTVSGIFHEVTVEPWRRPEDRATSWHVTVEAACAFEDPAAALVIHLDEPAE